jgi:isoquinoline 1-oxidoreductase beta subunit
MVSRRQFLWGAVFAGGLTVGFSAKPLLRLRARLKSVPPLGDPASIHIAPNGSITIYSTLTEMGQGIWTTLAQIVGEELDADWADLNVVMAPSWRAYYKPVGFWTGGSSSTQRLHEPLRKIAAVVRQMLVNEAARRWGVSPETCATEKGEVVHGATARRLGYGALAAGAAEQAIPEIAPLKPPNGRYVGRSPHRLDLAAKVDGSAIYGADVRIPGMRIAAISQSPFADGAIAAFDRSSALAVRGVERAFSIGDTVAVVAGNSWCAFQGLEAARIQWQRAAAVPDSEDLRTELTSAVRGDSSPDELSDTTIVRATYSVPLLYHAQLEPITATANVSRVSADIWTSTQAQEAVQAAVGKALGLWPHLVTVHSTLVGGGFGRRLDTDYAVTAARVARELGQPVQCVWSRESDAHQARHRTIAAACLESRLQDGLPTTLKARIATLGDFPRTGSVATTSYALPQAEIEFIANHAPIRSGSWRSVDASQNVFFRESFIDECAHAAGRDRLEYRKALLANNARALRVVETAAALSEWSSAGGRERFRGIAFHDGFGSIAAQVVELSRAADQRLRIERIVAVVDCGTVVHPDNVRAQIEGGVLFGLSAALREEAVIRNGSLSTANFDKYNVLRMHEAPAVEVEVLETPDAPLGGIGEVGVPLVAPALANAIFAATGIRARDLPLSRLSDVHVL